jgi:hypothetical protein
MSNHRFVEDLAAGMQCTSLLPAIPHTGLPFPHSFRASLRAAAANDMKSACYSLMAIVSDSRSR